MSEHYTRNTEGAPKWCNACGRITVHKVSGGRIGRCTEHEFKGYKNSGMTRKQFERKKAAERAAMPNLFGGER